MGPPHVTAGAVGLLTMIVGATRCAFRFGVSGLAAGLVVRRLGLRRVAGFRGVTVLRRRLLVLVTAGLTIAGVGTARATVWSIQRPPTVDADLLGVSCATSSACTAVGGSLGRPRQVGTALVGATSTPLTHRLRA